MTSQETFRREENAEPGRALNYGRLPPPSASVFYVSLRFWIRDGEIVRHFVRSTVTEHAIGPDLAEVHESIEGIMEERFRVVRKQSDEAVEELQRRATEQRQMAEELERGSREHSDDSDRR